MERFNHKRLEMESDSINALTKDSCLDMSELALVDDNHYRAGIPVSLVSLQTEDKPLEVSAFWPSTVSNVRHGHDSGTQSIGYALHSTLTLQSESANENTRRGKCRKSSMNDLDGERYRPSWVFRREAAFVILLTSCLPKKLDSNRMSAPAHVPRSP
jgi:hypothetical protein